MSYTVYVGGLLFFCYTIYMNRASAFGMSLAAYIGWHYSAALAEWTRIARDIAWFISNYFSIALLFRTLFMPFRRLDATENSGFFDWFITSTLMRVVGILVRIPVLLIGVLLWLLWWILYGIIVLVWIALPAILVFLAWRAYHLLQ